MPSAVLLYGGKSCSTIDTKKDNLEEPSVPYWLSLILIFLSDIYEQHFHTRLVDWIFKTCHVC